MTNLNITERRANEIIILDLDGKINCGQGCGKLHKALRRLIKSGEKKVLLNLEGVSSIDSSGVGELVGGYTALKRTGGEMKLFHLSPCVRELMVLTRLLPFFGVYDDEAYAVEHFDMPVMKAAGVSLL
jgi:anti-sigma B factor antagonist